MDRKNWSLDQWYALSDEAKDYEFARDEFLMCQLIDLEKSNITYDEEDKKSYADMVAISMLRMARLGLKG